MIGNSFKTTEGIFLRPISLPNTVDLSVFSTAWAQARFSRALMNSVVSTVATVLMVLLFAALAAFPLARMNFTGNTIILRFFVVSIIVSAPVIVIPLFYMLINQKLYNTLGAIIVTNATMGIPLAVYLFWGFFKEIPLEIEESTQIDGCARWTFFWSFVVPLSRPVIATIAIFSVALDVERVHLLTDLPEERSGEDHSPATFRVLLQVQRRMVQLVCHL